jgi:hypothetical protein
VGTRPTPYKIASALAKSSLFRVLFALFCNPQRVVFLWNWKSAWLSLILRGPIFVAATIQRGFSATISALFTECLVCAATAGFYGALVQNLRAATPLWLTGLFLAVVVPAVFQSLEWLLHSLRGTPHLRAAEIVSLGVSVVSSLFNWYAMRRGVLLVGGEGRSFGSDLRSLPGLFLDFVRVPLHARRGGRGPANSISHSTAAESPES